MQFYYGSQMPLRVLDEAEFWKQQEVEHTVVIKELVPQLEEKYSDQLKKWRRELAETRQRVVRFMETAIRMNGTFTYDLYRDLLQLIQHCLSQSQRFIHFCRQLTEQSRPIKTSPTLITVMNHIIDESEYFIGIAQTILYKKGM